MINFDNLSDPEYFKSVIEDINNTTEVFILENQLKMLSIKLNKQKNGIDNGTPVDLADARMLVGAIRARVKTLTEAMRRYPNTEDGGRIMQLYPTSVSNRAGSISLVILIVNIAIITVMYTLLFFAHFIK